MSDLIKSMSGNDDLYKAMLSTDGKSILNLVEPTSKNLAWGLNPRGIRERFFNMNPEILRNIAQRVGIVAAIHNVRAMQIKQFAFPSYNDDDVGFRIKLKHKKRTPIAKQEKEMHEIEEFFLHSGYTDFDGAEYREDGLLEILEMLVRDFLTIDTIAIHPRRNRAGRMLDFWILDGATIRRTEADTGYMGDPSIRYVQQIGGGTIIETFRADELVYYYGNRRTEIKKRGYGYSQLEQCIDLITAWLFGMAYNKEFFNTSAMPKGIMTFSGNQMDTQQLEELQRQWVNMFRGIKGMWKTPFLGYDAKWQNISPSNRDMEFSQYIQMLGSWICAVHGIDSAELGIRLNQAQNVVNDNQEAKIGFSQDRGLKNLLTSIQRVFNLVIKQQPEWDDYKFEFTGIDVKNQKDILDVEEAQLKTYMTINEKRAEKDLEPIKGGEIVENAMYIQYLQQLQAQEQMMAQSMAYPTPGTEEEGTEGESQPSGDTSQTQGEVQKTKDNYIEIIL